MNKTMQSIYDAVSRNDNLRIHGTNMETMERGLRYEVDNGAVFYWGHKVAEFTKDSVTIDLCGYHTMTTFKVINQVLDALVYGCSVYRAKKKTWLQVGDIVKEWDGSPYTIDRR